MIWGYPILGNLQILVGEHPIFTFLLVKWLLSSPPSTVLLLSPPPSSFFFVGSVQICTFTRSFGVIIFFCWLHFLCCCFDLYYSWVQLHLCPFYHCVFPIWMWFYPKIRQKPVKNPKSSGLKHHKFPTRKTFRRFSLRIVQKPTYRVGLRQVSELETCWWWSTRLLGVEMGYMGIPSGKHTKNDGKIHHFSWENPL